MNLISLRKLCIKVTFVTISIGMFSNQILAQKADIPFHTETYSWNTGSIDGVSIPKGRDKFSARKIVSSSNAPWLQLNFLDTKLGPNSYIEIISMKDGATQQLDAVSLREWGFNSAFFNGDALEVKLFVGKSDKNVILNIPQIKVGEYVTPMRTICGVDDRIASNEPRVARIDPIGCTGWIISNGKYLTAGHCLDVSGNDVLSFNPPASLAGGTVQFPGPEDQYSINQGSFQNVNGGVGNDWGIFSVFDNAMTGVQPIDVQGFFNIRQDFSPANIRITGFGLDSGSTNQTNQTSVGPNTGSSGTTMRYATDTRGGNSGSPVIDEATGEAVGIHTHGGCDSGNNSGTSFFHANLWSAIGPLDPGPDPDPDLACPAGSIDFNSLNLASYSNQNVTNSTAVENAGDTLLLTGNTWVRSTQSFSITPNTMIDFMFSSTSEGEIHAIGFDNNDTLNDNPRHFQFWGTQNWNGTGKINLNPQYSGGGSFQSYTIPVGQNYTGSMNLVFTNDKDSGTLNNNSRFACVRVYESVSSCDVNESFEGGMGGWTTSGTCSTGAFISGTPDFVSNSGVTTQLAGAQEGSFALYTQPNTISAGEDDVDGGECIATSPVYNASADSTVSLQYFHGQRDQGDDASDGFNLEVSFDGGAFISIVSIGDVTTNAVWTAASAQAFAGETVQLRVRAADGVSNGDLIEAGIDNVQICQ